jgi:TM2 domain-containing membrane protein YozV
MSEQPIAAFDTTRDLPPEISPEPIDKRPIYIGVGVAVAFVVIFLGVGWLLFVNPVATAILRDIFIIYMGLGIFVIILLLIILVVLTAYLVLKTNDLVQLLDREVRPVLSDVQSTLGNVRGTTQFIGEQAVKPVITTMSTVSAVQAIFRTLFRRN